MKHAIRQIHFVGVGGVGMSGIAEILHNLGYIVTGSDLVNSPTLQRLSELGIRTRVGHAPENIVGADAVVISSAVHADNPEVVAAREKHIPVGSRAVMLGELMRLRKGIAVAGTHGKTTTTSLIAAVLAQAGLDPTFVIGGKLNSAGANARLGAGEYIVAEADESDASFLHLSPVMAVVTNIDADHMDTYDHDLSKLKKAFVDFLHRMPFYGAAVLCLENPRVREIVPEITCTVSGYGFGDEAQIQAVDLRAAGSRMHFTVKRRGRRGHPDLPDLPIVLNLAGAHNVLNALAAVTVAMHLGIEDVTLRKALADFKGVGRRFQNYGDLPAKGGGSFTLIDDYGHHPAEMAATLAAVRGAFPERRLVLAFQPHRYTRTRDCFEDFVKILGTVDRLLLTEVYPAGEEPIVAADGRSLARAVRVAGKVEPVFVENVTDLPEYIAAHAENNDVVLCMGAGSIGTAAGKVAALCTQDR